MGNQSDTLKQDVQVLQDQVRSLKEARQKEIPQREKKEKQMKMLQQMVQQLQQDQSNKAEQVQIETLKLKQEQSKECQKQKDLEQEQEKTKQEAHKERTARLKNEITIKQGENLTKLSEFTNNIEGLPKETTTVLLNYAQSLVDEDGPLTIGDENLSDSSLPGGSVPDTNYYL